MKRGSRTPVVALAAFVVLLLTGCGGETTNTNAGGDGDRPGPEPQATTQDSGQNGAGKRGGAKGQGSGKKQSGPAQGNSGSATAPPPTGPAPTPSGPLPNEGTKKVAPGVPTAKGGDNSIQKFGVESRSTDRVAATRALKTYLDARAAGDWERACAEVSAGLKAEFRQFGQQSTPDEPPGCAEILRTLTLEVPPSALRTAATIRVLSMRLDGSTAFVVYRNGEGTPSAIPMAGEGGAWKVSALDGSALVLGAASF